MVTLQTCFLSYHFCIPPNMVPCEEWILNKLIWLYRPNSTFTLSWSESHHFTDHLVRQPWGDGGGQESPAGFRDGALPPLPDPGRTLCCLLYLAEFHVLCWQVLHSCFWMPYWSLYTASHSPFILWTKSLMVLYTFSTSIYPALHENPFQ